jgi:hypothetical protein
VSDSSPKKQVVIDRMIVTCLGCRSERKFYPDVPIAGVDAFEAWLKSIPQCACGATHCDVKAHMLETGE